MADAGLAHHFEDLGQQHEAQRFGTWLFLATEVLFFGGLFTAYAVYRWLHPEAFAEASRHLALPAGALNTAVLLLSSFTMARAVAAAWEGRRRATLALLATTALLGVVFLAVKGWEYAHAVHGGLVPGDPGLPVGAGLFAGLYFGMTGLHAAHLVAGIGLLAVVAVLAGRARDVSQRRMAVELAGLYWHFVDVVWIVLFPLLYLVGPRG